MNKVAFITGAGGYIGSETAVTLAKHGIRIAVCDINPETIEKTVKRIEEIGGEAKGYVFDVTDSQSVDDTVDKIVNDFGRLDIMVHVAGGSARIAGKELKDLGSIFTAMEKLEKDYDVKFVVTCSAAKEDLPEFVLKHV